MLTAAGVRDLVERLAVAAREGGPEARLEGLKALGSCDAREWLSLDQAARSFAGGGSPVGGPKGWRDADVTEPTGFVAAVTSFHADGRVRQRATRVLATISGPVPVTALAVRLLDHVVQVREEAARALHGRLGPEDAAPVLGVLLAGRDRGRASAALAWASGVLVGRVPVTELVDVLLRRGERDVRRWALDLAHEQDLLPADRLLEIVELDPDPWVRTVAAGWLLPVATPDQLRALLVSRTAEARLTALVRLPDDALAEEALLPLLLDRVPRVREQARRRARQRGIDVARWYREQVTGPGLSDHGLVACLDGLAVEGGPEDVPVLGAHLRHDGSRVRVAALSGVTAHMSRPDAVALAAPLLLDVSPRVASAAARTLVRTGAPRGATEAAWASTQPWSRRAGWRTDRGRGGWDRLVADLRAAAHEDPVLAAEGVAGVGSWVRTGAATTWGTLSDAQQDAVARGLRAGALDAATARSVAFHAGITRDRAVPVSATTQHSPDDAGPPSPRRPWLRLLRRPPDR